MSNKEGIMEIKYFYKGFNYSQDGPGNRLVYHLQGCNMRCPWCSNPEGMRFTDKCKSAEVSEVVEEIISVKPMLFEDGGVTFTGGEATLQLPAIYEIMKRVKEQDINTAIETNSTSTELTKLLPVCDFFMTDFKSPLPHKYKEVTGGDLNLITNNIRALSKKTHVNIRIPLIHGYNDDGESLTGFVKFFLSLQKDGCSFDVELLPYHEYGKEKWQKQGREYMMHDAFVTDETLNRFIKAFEENNIKLITT